MENLNLRIVEALAEVPAADGLEKVDVVVEHDFDGKRKIVVRQLAWGNGVGWFVQRTIRLTDAQAKEIAISIANVSQQPAKEDAAPASTTDAPGRLVLFSSGTDLTN